MDARRTFLLKRVVILVIFMLSLTAYSQHTDLPSKEDFDDLTPNAASKKDCYCSYVEIRLKHLGTFLNDQRESPRQNLKSILYFLGTLMMYICFVFLRNVHYSYKIFDINFLFNQAQELVPQKIQSYWTLQREMLYPFYRHFRENFMVNNNRQVSVYYFFESETQRAASFINIKEPSPVSILNLARYGFYYVPNDQLVKCSGCGKRIQLKDFNEDPSNSEFHASVSCPFVLSISPTLTQESLVSQQGDETKSNAAKSEDKSQAELTPTGYAIGGDLDETDINPSIALPTSQETSCADASSEVFKSDDENNMARGLQGNRKVPVELSRSMKEGQEERDSLPNPITRDDDSDSDGPPELHHFSPSSSPDASSDLGQQTAICPSSSAGVDKWNSVRHNMDSTKERPQSRRFEDGQAKSVKFEWKDRDNFVSECFASKTENKRHGELDWTKACQKNEVHDSFFAVDKVKKSQFPDYLQFSQLHSLVICASNLTVKVLCKSKSLDRPDDDTCTVKHSNGSSFRCGTGYVWLDTKEDNAESLVRQIKASLPKSKKEKVKQLWSHRMGKTTKYYFSVQTTRHVVFDHSEAKHTEVLFEIQDEKRQNVKRFRGKGIFAIPEKVEGNYETTILCKSSDPELQRALEKERLNYISLKQNLPREVMSELLEACFVISYPHGLNKTVTFGHSTIVKYCLSQLEQDASNRQFERFITNGKGSHTQDIREALIYTAGTCSGSSGALVFSCRNIRQQPDQDMTIQPIVWTHNGVEKESGLNCTVMSSYQPELTEVTNIPPKNKTPPTAKSCSDSANSTSGTGPKAPSYITMEARLQSFKQGYKSACKHSSLELAEAGFYFAGYDDCIKCFYCGLGLKGWSSKNNIFEEHLRLVPNCSFLKAHKDDTERKVEPALLFDESVKTSESLQVTLLKSERKKLTSKFICKVCWKYPASELFLACGDVFACERCSNFLYTCPLCNKPIFATVTAYLS